MTSTRSDVGVPTPMPLDYAPAAPLRRRRFIRRTVAIVMIAGLTFASLHWGQEFWTKALFLHHQRGCLRYTAPPEQVIFDSDPARVAVLAKDKNFVISGGCAYRKPPPDWEAMWAGLSPRVPITKPSAVIFLHERTVGGIRRLIVVERTAAANESPLFLPGYDVDTRAIDPATVRRGARDIPMMFASDVSDMVGQPFDLRIYAGQPDPADDLHFTIRYEFRGKTHTADGRVRADGGVDFKRSED
jgi:hypothetical protein